MTTPLPYPILVSIDEMVPAYPSGTYPLRVLGFGARTLEEARVEAAKDIALLSARLGREHRATFAEVCKTCLVTGVKPGCKRKACPTCNGRGTVAIEGSTK